jgi:hypothetical protein
MRGWRCRCLSAASADDRSIGLFRVVVAACLLLELAGSWPDRCEFYSEEGVLPLGDDDTTLILHRGHTCSVTTALFVVHGFAAAMLLMGVWSRCSAALAYALQLSLLHRNPHVQTGDACLLCMCLLWAALLPTIGARWRVPTRATAATAKAAPPSSSAPSSAPSVAALGLKVSVALFYLTSAVIKARERRHTSRAPGLGDRESSRSPSPWLAGTAVAEALTCCEYRTALGDILLAAPSACIVLTYATLGLEAAGPGLLLLLDSVERLVVLVLFLGMHLAMHLTMELGHFSLIATGALCAFVPSDGWLLLSAVLEAMALPSLLPSVRTAAPRSPPPPPPPHDGVQRVRTGTLPSMVGGVLSSLLLVAAVAVSIESLDTENLARSRQRPRDDSRLPAFPLALFASVGRSLGVPPRADMFAPPPNECGHWVLPATLADGRRVDAFSLRHSPRGSPPRPLHATDLRSTPRLLPSTLLWHRFHETLSDSSTEETAEAAALRQSLALSYCRAFPQLAHVEVVLLVEQYAFGSPTPAVYRVTERRLADVTCPGHAAHSRKPPLSSGDSTAGEAAMPLQERAQPRSQATPPAAADPVLELELFDSTVSAVEWWGGRLASPAPCV